MATIGQDGSRGTNRLSAIAASLDAIPKNSEPGFMKLGMELQSIYSDAADLSRQTLETVKLIGGESEQGLLTKVGTLVKASLEKVRICQATASENHDLAETHVSEVTKHLSNSYSLCAAFNKTARYLKAVGLQMRIECSRSTQSMEMFSVVAHEIGAVSSRFTETAEKIRDDSETARQGQVSAQAKTSESLRQLFKLADDTEQTVQLSMQEIEKVMGLSLETLEQAGVRSRRISDHVGEIVMGIQFHDNMRQRIEHIIEALVEVEKRCEKNAFSADPDITPSNESSTAHAILELQKAQLHNIISEINAVHERAGQAFQEIGNEVDNLTQGLSSLETELSDDSLYRQGETQDPFESLKSGLLHQHRLIDQGFSLVEDMNKTAVQASETVTELSSHTQSVRELSFETHLTAINAMIKAKQLGAEGMALDKLVQEARSVSERSNLFAANVEEIQDLIAASARKLQSRPQEEVRDDEAIISLNDVLEEISQGGAQFRENSLDAFNRAGALKETISRVSRELDFLPALACELAEHQQHLEEMSRTLNPSAGEETTLTQEEIDEIRESYTMQEERSVHEQFIDQTCASIDADGEDLEPDGPIAGMTDFESPLPLTGETTNKDCDLGDNIELF